MKSDLWNLLGDAFEYYIQTQNVSKIKQFVDFFPFVITFNDGYYFTKIVETSNCELIQLFLENGAEVSVKEMKLMLDHYNFYGLTLVYHLTDTNMNIISGNELYKIFLNSIQNQPRKKSDLII